MQSGRREDYVWKSQNSKLHEQGRLHLDFGGHSYPRREALDRSPCSRSLSPREIDGTRYELSSGQLIDTIDRRDNDWRLRIGRNNGVRSRSPSYGQVRQRSHFEVVFPPTNHKNFSDIQHIRGLPEPTKFPTDHEILAYEHDLRYRQDDLGMGKEREIMESRWTDVAGQSMPDKKLLVTNDGTGIELYSSPLVQGPKPFYGDSSGYHLPSSRISDLQSIDCKRQKFHDPIFLESDKLPVVESHRVEDHHRFKSRNVAYPVNSEFYPREYASSSSGPLTSKCLNSNRDAEYSKISDEISMRHENIMDHVGFNSYGKSTVVDSAIDLGVGKRNRALDQQGANFHRRECEDYIEGTLSDLRGFSSEGIQRIAQTHNYIDYDSAVGSDHGDILRPEVADSGLLQNTEDLYANYRSGRAYEHYGLKKQTVLDYPYVKRTTNVKHDDDYAVAGINHIETGRRVSRDYELLHMNPSQKMFHARSNNGSERDVSPQQLEERLHESLMSKCEEETYRNAERVQRMNEDVASYNFRDQSLKRKFFEEDLDFHRISMPHEYIPTKVVNQYDSDEEGIDDNTSGRYTSRDTVFEHNKYRHSSKKYDRHNSYVSNKSISYRSHLNHEHKYNSVPRYIKGNRRNVSSSGIRFKKIDQRNSLHRQHKVWKKTEEVNDNIHANDDHPLDDLLTLKSEPSELSEEFKQLIHEAFLKYSKKLNTQPGERQRYKKQGNAGSLFCVVCGISYSKEFRDTESLVRHAYMCCKVRLRAQHLGLLKAICVLMGWNSVIPQDTTTWVPDVLPEAEALAQKEDLIIWPPVLVIRNISLSHSNPDKWRVVTIETLESFLRSKGLLKGRVKICLGKPADQSVIILKFLPTFSGLTDAERLHKYFSDKKHGRVDFEIAKGNRGESWELAKEEDKIEERILFGYMGIAENLDEVEFNIKKLSLIKSKKEILEL